jgi:hypothetical protein
LDRTFKLDQLRFHLFQFGKNPRVLGVRKHGNVLFQIQGKHADDGFVSPHILATHRLQDEVQGRSFGYAFLWQKLSKQMLHEPKRRADNLLGVFDEGFVRHDGKMKLCVCSTLFVFNRQNAQFSAI